MIIAQEHLDEQSVKHLCLASTFYDQLLTPLLFEISTLKPDIDSLGKAIQIAETPLLARHIRVLEIHSHVVPELIYPANMEGFVQKHNDLEEKFPDLPMVDITMQPRLYYYSYLSIRAKQAANRQASLVNELLHMLSQLPNLGDHFPARTRALTR